MNFQIDLTKSISHPRLLGHIFIIKSDQKGIDRVIESLNPPLTEILHSDLVGELLADKYGIGFGESESTIAFGKHPLKVDHAVRFIVLFKVLNNLRDNAKWTARSGIFYKIIAMSDDHVFYWHETLEKEGARALYALMILVGCNPWD